MTNLPTLETVRTRYGWIARYVRGDVVVSKGYASSRPMAVTRARRKAWAVLNAGAPS